MFREIIRVRREGVNVRVVFLIGVVVVVGYGYSRYRR